MTEEEKAAEAWAEALREIQDELATGRMRSIAWLADRGESPEGNTKYHFGHFGYKEPRLVLTRTLNTMLDGAKPDRTN